MSAGESMSSQSFEVRCGRCDVTFPIETKRCIHCGGATGAARGFSLGNRGFGTRASASDAATASPFETAYGTDDDEFVLRDESGKLSAGADVGGAAGDAGSSPLKSLVRSMGGVIWVLLLVGFSLVRSCGGE